MPCEIIQVESKKVEHTERDQNGGFQGKDCGVEEMGGKKFLLTFFLKSYNLDFDRLTYLPDILSIVNNINTSMHRRNAVCLSMAEKKRPVEKKLKFLQTGIIYPHSFTTIIKEISDEIEIIYINENYHYFYFLIKFYFPSKEDSYIQQFHNTYAMFIFFTEKIIYFFLDNIFIYFFHF